LIVSRRLPDDTRLVQWAKRGGIRYIWKTWREGQHWFAEVKAWKGDDVYGWYSSSGVESEQRVLDHAINDLLTGHKQPASGQINLRNPLAERNHRRR